METIETYKIWCLSTATNDTPYVLYWQYVYKQRNIYQLTYVYHRFIRIHTGMYINQHTFTQDARAYTAIRTCLLITAAAD